MFLQDISLASPENRISLSEKTELSRIISRKNVLARYLISLSEKTELSVIISRKNVLARYLISLSEKTELSHIISGRSKIKPLRKLSLLSLGRMFLQDISLALQRKQNCLVLSLGRMFLQDISLASPEKKISLGRMFLQELSLYYLSEECSCKISH
ncbi:unnamed protein product [Acanthosepion pharaonis]|uniref:Uncharacterized protein n=1 Tax=Acanthosepion pharaonis TaxID=158019 RepID=A0A812BK87_ACAPH|nr:unnamed protein product [Sepia pharaonis]